jgi:hypothetical protein
VFSDARRLRGTLQGMDDDTAGGCYAALLSGEDGPSRGWLRRQTLLEAGGGAGLVLGHTQRGLRELREHDSPLADARARLRVSRTTRIGPRPRRWPPPGVVCE